MRFIAVIFSLMCNVVFNLVIVILDVLSHVRKRRCTVFICSCLIDSLFRRDSIVALDFAIPDGNGKVYVMLIT